MADGAIGGYFRKLNRFSSLSLLLLLSSEALTAAVSEISSTARMIDWGSFLQIKVK